MKIFELQNKDDVLEKSDLLIIKESTFLSTDDLISWVLSVDLSKFKVNVLLLDVNRGGDLSQVFNKVNGVCHNLKSAKIIYQCLTEPVTEDVIDEFGGVSIEEFSEHLDQYNKSWNELNKRDDGSTC